MRSFRLVVLPGDGIGPEVTAAALDVLDAAGELYGIRFERRDYLFGGCSIERHGVPLTDEVLDACKASDAVLMGAVGGPEWELSHVRPEQGLLKLRAGLGVFANLRPAKIWPGLASMSPLKAPSPIDILIVRELTGGLYFGKSGLFSDEYGNMTAYDTMTYSEAEIERVCRVAFEAAGRRRKKLTSVDKANVLESSRLWRETAVRLSREYPDVELSHMLVDNAAMQLVLTPAQFDVIVTENMFGDILSDEAGAVCGSIGLLPSASLGMPDTPGLFEPVHGSAPDIAGRNLANPIAAVLSAAMLLRHGLSQDAAADCVERAVEKTLREKFLTPDLGGGAGTREVGEKIKSNLIKHI